MIVVRDFDRLKGKELVATIGFFDGVHLGHRFLIDEMKEIAKARNLPSAVITFPEHPRAVLHADYQPKLLNSSEKVTAIRDYRSRLLHRIGFYDRAIPALGQGIHYLYFSEEPACKDLIDRI